MEFLCCLLCIVLGAVSAYDPDLFWQLEHFWAVEGGAPTKAYRIVRRAVGVFCVCAGAAGLVILTLL